METRKRTEIIQDISSYFLSLKNGETIESVRNLSKTMGASIGLLSEVITEIEDAGAVSLEKRGPLGTQITDMSIGKLWEIARKEPLVIAHTLPSNHRYEGFASGLKTALTNANLETYFIFIRGSRTRISALREGRCHIAITSLFAANGLCTRKEDIAFTFSPCTFTSAHHIYLRSSAKRNQTGLVVGVDPDSYDQNHLSQIEFENKDVEYKHINYMNIFRCLSSGEIDAAIWTEDDMRPHLNENVVQLPLSAHTQQKVNQSDTQAALIMHKEDKLIGEVIKKTIQPDQVLQIQKDVIEGKRVPAY